MPGRRARALTVVALLVVGAGATALWLDSAAGRRMRAAHQGEAELEQLFVQQQAFLAALDEFVSLPPRGAALDGRSAEWSDEPCPPDCRALALEACQSYACVEFRPSATVWHRYACRAGRRGDVYDVTCAAAADLDGDGEVSVHVVGTGTTGVVALAPPELGAPVSLGRCAAPGAVPARQVYDCTPGEL
jgi:hypothetical protein